MAALRRIKGKAKKSVTKIRKVTLKLRSPVKVRKKEVAVTPRTKEEIFGMQEVVIGQAKFSHPQVSRPYRSMPQDLPWGYGTDKIILQVRDPWWIYAYWEITGGAFDRLRQHLGHEYAKAKRIIRVYDVSYIIFDGTNAHRFFDIEITPEANNWYIDTGAPGRYWCVEIGLKLSNGKFIRILRSNIVYTPLEGPSWITDEEWMIPDDMFARLYGMGFGLGKSSPVGKAWQERIKKQLYSGVFVSSGASSPVRRPPRERKFWLVVNTELIVYGATEPDAKVRVQGREIKLRPDGTFSLRFSLPDGKQVIPVQAESQDAMEERIITPIVTKETK
jgi:hypothetical protein